MEDLASAWAGAVVERAVNQAANRAGSKLLGAFTSAKNSLFGTPYRESQPVYRQVHLPKVMRRNAYRRRRPRFRRVKRRRFSRRRYARRSARSSRITTAQHDVSRVYRSGRGRGMRSFVRKVQNALVQLQPLGLYTFQYNILTTGAVNTDSLVSVMIGGMTVSNQDELFQAMRSSYAGITTAADAKKFEIYIRSLVVDVQLTNTGSLPITVDVYKLLCRRAYSSAVTVDSQLTTALGEIGADANGNTVTTNRPTLTPFDAPNFCEFWKILSKQTTILPAGNFISMQTRNKRTMKIEGKLFTTAPQAMPYYTQAYLFIVRGSPQNSAGTAQLSAPSFVVSYQTNVHMCGPPGNQSEFGRTA